MGVWIGYYPSNADGSVNWNAGLGWVGADTTSATWTKVAKSYTAPVGSTWAFLYLQVSITTAVGDFDAIYARKMVDGTIIRADAIKTSDYAEDGSGNPTAGAKMSVGVATPLKIGPGGMKVGTHTMDELQVAALKAIGRADASASQVWYRGNNDPAVLGGAPNISRFFLYGDNCQTAPCHFDGTYLWTVWRLEIAPSAASDNLDGLRYVKFDFSDYADLNWKATYYINVPDRLYFNAANHADLGNVAKVTFITRMSGADYFTDSAGKASPKYPALHRDHGGPAASHPPSRPKASGGGFIACLGPCPDRAGRPSSRSAPSQLAGLVAPL